MLTKKIVYGWSRPRSWGGELKLKSHISFLVTHTKRGMRRSEPHKFWPNTAGEINPGLKHKKSHLLLLKFDWWQSDLAKWWCLERVWAVPVTTLHYSLITSLWSLSGDHMVRQASIQYQTGDDHLDQQNICHSKHIDNTSSNSHPHIPISTENTWLREHHLGFSHGKSAYF